jgi:hypothetical protein
MVESVCRQKMCVQESMHSMNVCVCVCVCGPIITTARSYSRVQPMHVLHRRLRVAPQYLKEGLSPPPDKKKNQPPSLVPVHQAINRILEYFWGGHFPYISPSFSSGTSVIEFI